MLFRLPRRQSDRTSELTTCQGAPGARAASPSRRRTRKKRRRVGAQSEWADLLLCSLVAPPSLDRLAPDDDVLGLHSSAASVLSLSLGRQEFHLAVQLIQYSAAHNEAAR